MNSQRIATPYTITGLRLAFILGSFYLWRFWCLNSPNGAGFWAFNGTAAFMFALAVVSFVRKPAIKWIISSSVVIISLTVSVAFLAIVSYRNSFLTLSVTLIVWMAIPLSLAVYFVLDPNVERYYGKGR